MAVMGLLGHFRGPDGHRAADFFQRCLKTSALGVRVSCECGSHVGRVLTGGSLYAFAPQRGCFWSGVCSLLVRSFRIWSDLGLLGLILVSGRCILFGHFGLASGLIKLSLRAGFWLTEGGLTSPFQFWFWSMKGFEVSIESFGVWKLVPKTSGYMLSGPGPPPPPNGTPPVGAAVVSRTRHELQLLNYEGCMAMVMVPAVL